MKLHLLTAFAVGSITSVAMADLPRYRVTQIGPPAGVTVDGFYPRGLNDAGQVVGDVWIPGNNGGSAFRWSVAGGMQTSHLNGGVSAEDISNNGTIVGWASLYGAFPTGGNKAIIWSDINDPQVITPLAGVPTFAYGINDAGTAKVGKIWGAAVRFDGQTYTRLQAAGGTYDTDEAFDVNNSGVIIGSRGGGGGARWFSSGTLTSVVPNAHFGAINNRGQIAGALSNVAGYWSATMEFTAIPGHQATDIADNGSVLSFNVSRPSSDNMTIHVPGVGTAALSDRLAAHDGSWKFDQSHAINNRGQITGWGYHDPDGTGPLPSAQAGFFLDPVRSPGDTDYDDAVDFDDLLALAQHYGSSDFVFWEQGDFDFSGTVDFDDLLTLAQNYGGPALTGDGLGTADFAADWALATSLVPEPTATLSLGLLAAGLARRTGRRATLD